MLPAMTGLDTVNAAVVRVPVEGLKVSFVELVPTVVSVPVVTSSNRRYRVAFVVVSSVIAAEPPPALPFAAAVMRPFASTVMLAFVYEPATTAVLASVDAMDTPLVRSELIDPVTSPVRANVRVVERAVAVLALPVSAPVKVGAITEVAA